MSGYSSPKPTSELAVRVASALTLAAIALFLLYLGGTSFAILCSVGAALIALEFRALAAERLSRELGLAMLALLALVIALWFGAGPDDAALALAGGVAVLTVWELLSQRAAWAATGLAYSALPFLALAILRGREPEGAIIVALIFAMVWGADILAYFAGRAIGGPKLAPQISPKKTWAGFVGGIAGSLLLTVAVAFGFRVSFGLGLLALAALMSVVSQIGDLCESWIKRHFGKKDSSNLIPGHGGAMDRLDGLIFASVVIWFAAIALGAEALVPGAPARVLAGRLIGG